MVDIESNLTGDLSGALDKFQKLIQEEVLFSGVAAMAKVIYDEVKLNAEKHVKTGLLRDSIYRAYSPEKSSNTEKTYRVSWNKRTAPHGHLIEWGTSRAPAYPFVRPAFDRVNDAIEAGKMRMAEKLGEISGEP